MFNWTLFLLLVVICIPGLVISTPRLVKALQRTIEANLKEGQTMPPRPMLIGLSLLQNLVIVGIAAAVGTALTPRIGLRAPFFEALVAGDSLWPALMPQFGPALSVGIGGAFLFLVVYYGIVQPRLDEHSLKAADNLRMNLGVWGRLLYCGIVEEVLTRWGLMSLLVWIGAVLWGTVTPVVVWAAIVVTGILFGLGHLPAHFAAGCRKTPIFIGSVIGLNLWVSLLFGWLFWQVGLLAAMLAHMFFHSLWLPFEFRTVQPHA